MSRRTNKMYFKHQKYDRKAKILTQLKHKNKNKDSF